MIKNCIFFLGLPGSGKSTYIKEMYDDRAVNTFEYNTENGYWTTILPTDTYEKSAELLIHNILTDEKKNKINVISADDVKHYIYGYTDEHPEIVHESSVQITREIMFKLASDDNIQLDTVILDGGGINNKYNVSIINYLKEHGCQNITCVFLDTPIDVCIKRISGRDRKVPVEEIYKKNLKLEACRNRYINLCDNFIRVDYFTNKYLLLDMDGTLACYGKAKKDIYGNSDFVSSQLFKNLKPVKHVIDFIKETYKDNMKNVYIVTACANSIAWDEKNEWLDHNFPEIPKENRLFVGNKNYKHVFIEQLCHKNKWKVNDVTLVDDFHDTLDKCAEIGINTIHPSNIYAITDKYSYQA